MDDVRGQSIREKDERSKKMRDLAYRLSNDLINEKYTIGVVDQRFQTNIEGVYAAGLCVSQGGQTILTCAENGEKAGLNAFLYVKRLKEES